MTSRQGQADATSSGERPLSPSRLGLYLECPRKYQYDYEWGVSTPDESTRNLDSGSAMHRTMEWLCARVRAADPTDPDAPWRTEGFTEEWSLPWEPVPKSAVPNERVREFAAEEFDAAWSKETAATEYFSESHYRYDRRTAGAAIDAYLSDRGIEDVRQTMGVEVTLGVVRNGMELQGRIDNVVRTDEGIELIDYKRRLSNIISWQNDYLGEHRSGERFAPRRVKSLIQAGVYIEAAKDASFLPVSPSDDEAPTDEASDPVSVEFTFYGLLGSRSSDVEDVATPDGLVPEVDGSERSVEDIYDHHRESLWTVIEDCYRGIRAESFGARERLAERADESNGICDRCPYNDMCPEITEVEVTRIE